LPALERARAIFVGGRLMSDGFHGDGVVVIEGPLPEASPQAAGDEREFRRVFSNTPDLELFERTSARRDEAVLKIVLAERGIVLATAAEADAVLRVLRTGPDPNRLKPPAYGLASFAGRRTAAPQAIAAKLGPKLRELGEGLTTYVGVVDAGDSLNVEVWLNYVSETYAHRAADRGRSVLARLGMLGPPLGTLANSTTLVESGGSLRMKAAVPFAILAELH
jgi:hypothetical protein